jgi:hypothetical protein
MLFKLLVITAYLFGATTSFHDSLRQEFSTFDYRSLKAARRHSNVLKRSDEIVAKTSIELTYVEGMIYSSHSPAPFQDRSEMLLFTYASHNARVLSSRSSLLTLRIREQLCWRQHSICVSGSPRWRSPDPPCRRFRAPSGYGRMYAFDNDINLSRCNFL